MPGVVSDMVELLKVCRSDAAVDAALERLERSADQAGIQDRVERLRRPIEQIRADRTAHRRRETELLRLLRTAQRLLATAEIDELLRVIVDAARDMLGSHVAHINLRGTDGRLTTIRTTAGAQTEAFRNQNTPDGSGLTGLVLRLRSPYVTEDYLSDPAIEHDPSGDRSVRADHLVSMAGAPMLDGAEAVGVLMASWRHRATVLDDQVDLLNSLASLAAVAVTSARRREEARRSREELEHANERFRRVNAQLEWGGQAHDRLLSLLLPDTPHEAVPQMLHDILEAPAAVLDPLGTVIATTPAGWNPRIGLQELAEIGAGSRALQGRAADRSTFWGCPAQAGGSPLAVLIVARSSLTEMEQRTLERAATTTALLLSTKQALVEARFRSSADLLADLVRGRGPTSGGHDARQLGIDLSSEHVVVVTSIVDVDRSQARAAFRQHVGSSGGILGEVDGRFVAVLPRPDPSVEAGRAAAALAAGGVRVAVGGSGPSTDASAVPRMFAVARDCSDAQSRLVGDGPATVETLGFVGLLLADPTRENLASFARERLDALETHDVARRTNLLGTLEEYLASDGSVQKSASRLHVHTNTIVQRLQRIERILDLDLRSTATAAELHIALQLRRLGANGTR